MAAADSLISELKALSISLVLSTLLAIAWRCIRHRQRIRRFCAANSCQSPNYERSWSTSLGLLKFLVLAQHYRSRTLLSYFSKLFDENSETYKSIILGQTVTFTCNAQNIKQLLVGSFQDYDIGPLRRHLFSPVTPLGIFLLDGAPWKDTRDHYGLEFRRTRSLWDGDMQEHHFQNMLRKVELEDGMLDLQDLFIRALTDLTSDFAIGESLDCLSPQQSSKKRKLEHDLGYVKAAIAANGISGPLHWLVERRRWFRSCRSVQRYVASFAAQARIRAVQHQQNNGSTAKNDGMTLHFIHRLAKHISSEDSLRDQTTTIVFAGVDPVASLLSSTFWLLLRDSRVMQKLRRRIEDVIGNRIPTYEDLQELTYLQHVFNEAMRLFPPVPFNARIANKHTVLPTGGGNNGRAPIMIAKGQMVFFFAWASHRSVAHFGEDAEHFRPERWEHLKSDVAGYMPFQLGPRKCPGQRFGLTTASYLTVRMIQTFERMESIDPRPWREHLLLNLENANGLATYLARV